MEPLYYLIIILNFENHRNFYIKGDLVMSWTRMTSQNDQSIGLQRNPYKMDHIQGVPGEINFGNMHRKQINEAGNKNRALKTVKRHWKHKAEFRNDHLSSETKIVVSKQIFDVGNIIRRQETYFLSITYSSGVKKQLYVSNFKRLFRNYAICLQSHFTVSKLCLLFRT